MAFHITKQSEEACTSRPPQDVGPVDNPEVVGENQSVAFVVVVFKRSRRGWRICWCYCCCCCCRRRDTSLSSTVRAERHCARKVQWVIGSREILPLGNEGRSVVVVFGFGNFVFFLCFSFLAPEWC